jgi:hypothetical protein
MKEMGAAHDWHTRFTSGFGGSREFRGGQPAAAQTIYPLTRAEILAGAKFDFKVEFPNTTAPKDVKVTVNGRDAAQVFGKAPIVEVNEEGLGHTAYWMREVSLTQPGPYEVTAAAGDATHTVKWEVFGTPQRRARNVILFIGDGLSMAHRTAARMLAKGMVEGRYGGELAIDDMPHMALVSTSGTDSIVTDSANSMSAYTTGPQVLRQRHGHLLRAQQERARAPQSRDHRRARQAPQRRHGRGRGHQYRDRGRDAGRRWSRTCAGAATTMRSYACSTTRSPT